MLGIAGLYLSVLLFRLTGKLLGGRASALELRAAIAWSAVPTVTSVAIYLIAIAAVQLSSAGPTSPVLIGALGIFVAALGAWALIAMILMVARVQRFRLVRTIASVVLAYLSIYAFLLIIALIFRTFLFHPFNVPSRAMEPTVLVGDYFLVSTFSYGYGRYSLPFSPPLFRGRVLAREPQRGDIVVFRLPKDDSINYVKRLVGLPGDHIQMINGLLYINGTPVKQEHIEDFIETDESGGTSPIKRWRETLPNGVGYTTLDRVPNGFYDNTPVYTVPAGHYFMIGDDRDNSTDSRVLSQVGYVPFENLVGRVEVIYFSIDRNSRQRQAALRFERFGLAVH